MLSKTLRAILEASAEESSVTGPSVDLLVEVWPTLLGEPLCHRTRPKSWQDGTLVIGVASRQWLQEVRRHQRQVHACIHRLLPWPVDQFEFLVESLPRADSQQPPTEQESPIEPADIDDPTVNEDLERLDDSVRGLVLRIRSHLDATS